MTDFSPSVSRLARLSQWWREIAARRATIARGLVWIAVLLMGVSAYGFRPQFESLAHYRPTLGPEDYYDPKAPWFFLAGTLALVAALILFPRPARHPEAIRRFPARIDPLRPDWVWLLLVPAVFALLIMAEANGELINMKGVWGLSPHLQFALLLIGIALLVLALAGIGFSRRGKEPGDREKTRAQQAAPLPLSPPTPLSLRSGERGEYNATPVLSKQREVSGDSPLSNPVGEGVGGEADFTQSDRPHPSISRFPGDRGKPGGEAARRYPEIIFVIVITLLALMIRLWNLNNTVRVMVDEGHFALGVTYFWTFPDVKLLAPMPTSASFPFIFSYGQAGMVEIFGRNLLGLRALSALLGALTIPALYVLAREILDRRTAVLATLILLTYPPQLHYSRLALNNIADPLFGTLALALLARGLRTRRRIDYTLAGVSLGFTQYFYEGGRLLYPALIAAWMIGGLIFWRPRPSLRGLLLLAVAFVLVAAPVYYTLVGDDFPLTDRLDKTQYNDQYWGYNREPDNFTTRITHFRHSLLTYINGPENTVFNYYLYYGGKYPLIFPAVVPAFLLGLVISAWGWRTPRVLLIGWVLATSVGNAMLVESSVSARYVVVFPGIALLIAVGIVETVRLVWLPRWPDRWRIVPALVLVGVISTAQLGYYFGPFLDLFNREVRYHVAYDSEDALLRSRAFPPQTQIYLIGEPMLPEGDAQRFLNFLVDDRTVFALKPAVFASLNLSSLRRDVDLAFYFGENDTASRDRLEAVFGPHPLQSSPYDVPQGKALVLFYVPALWPAPPGG